MSDNIKVAGYVKKEVYNGNIEYRNFNPDLVGLQLTSDGGTPLFTMGNFSITTNMDPKINKTFITNQFSDFYSLDKLVQTPEQAQTLLTNNAGTFLNLDKTSLKNYALFGSFTEFVRVSLEQIITKWPASLFLSPFTTNDIGQSIYLPTYEDYVYDIVSDTANFKVNTNLINNKFDINYLLNGSLADTFNETNNLRNLTVSYKSYSILVNDVEYSVLNFTGSTNLTDDYLYFTVKGDVFSGLTNILEYHIKPNKINEDLFFNGLNDFEGYLLNRKTFPKYRATFNIPTKSEQGVVIYSDQSLTWPVSDGYNIDYDSGEYIVYASQLVQIAQTNDEVSSNLMNRFLVSESISAFDTTPVHLAEEHMDTSGQKVNKTLQIYGVNFDEINNFITGIKFANSVSYNKQDNTPDKYLKNIARILGWELVSSVLENDLLTNYVKTAKSNYAGQAVGLTAVEADVELWRRIILNTPWIWKSKGARKSIEFLLNFIGAPQGLVEFNEYIYLADKPIDVELFKKLLELNNLDTDLSFYPIDGEGYPYFLPDTTSLYFQNDGLWYRETGGSGSTVDILTGNNPHLGPYDGGFKYINQLRTLIPNFSAVTITGETIVTGTTNLFTNYNFGDITDYSGETYVDVVNLDGTNISDCVVVTSEIVQDPMPSITYNDCGCPSDLADDDALSICVKKINKPVAKPCNRLANQPKPNNETGYYVFEYYQYNQDGSVYSVGGVPVMETSIFTDRECCKSLNGTPVYTDVVDSVTGNIQSGYACCFSNKCGCSTSCNWYLNLEPYYIIGQTLPYLTFTTLYGAGITKMVFPDASACPIDWATPVPNFTDSFTGEVGYAYQLTPYGLQNYQTLVSLYQNRADKGDCCNFNWPVKTAPTIRYNLFDRLNIYKEPDTFEYPFTTNIPQVVKCKTLNPSAYGGGNPVTISGPQAPWTFTPITIGTQFYVSNLLGAAPYNTLNGNYSISVDSLSSTLNTGLELNKKYVIQITNGVVTNIINFNMLEAC